jgi:hypothetical protein
MGCSTSIASTVAEAHNLVAPSTDKETDKETHSREPIRRTRDLSDELRARRRRNLPSRRWSGGRNSGSVWPTNDGRPPRPPRPGTASTSALHIFDSCPPMSYAVSEGACSCIDIQGFHRLIHSITVSAVPVASTPNSLAR